MKRFTLILTLLFTCLFSHIKAYDFIANGFAYTVTSVKDRTVRFDWVRDKVDNVVIPSTVTYNGIEFSVTAIGRNAFSGIESIRSVSIPTSVKEIESQAFNQCSLENFTWPGWITTIREDMFTNSKKLKSITISEGVTTLENYCFYYATGIEYISFPSTLKEIGNSFCGGTRIKKLNLPEGLEKLAPWQTELRNLQTLILPSTVKVSGSSGAEFFSSSHIETVMCKSRKNPIAHYVQAFYSYDPPQYLIIPEGTTSEYKYWPCVRIIETDVDNCDCDLIGNNIIKDNKIFTIVSTAPTCMAYLTDIDEPEISDTLYIPATVSDDINTYEVKGLSSYFTHYSHWKHIITDIKEPFDLPDGCFSNLVFFQATLHVPAGSAELYRNADGWGDFLYIVEDADETGISDELQSTTESVHISQKDGLLSITGLKFEDKVELYSANGSLLTSTKATNAKMDIDIESQKGHLVVVKVGQNTKKLLVR